MPAQPKHSEGGLLSFDLSRGLIVLEEAFLIYL